MSHSSIIGHFARVARPRKGQTFRRLSDGFVFRVMSASRTVPGAFLVCVDASRIFGWYDADAIAAGFVKVAS